MARSRRRSVPRGTRRTTSRRRRGDWCYRPNYRSGTISGYTATDLLGSYDETLTAFTSGAASSGAKILYDSKNRLVQPMRGGSGALTAAMPGAARANQRGPLIHMVVGVVYCEPTTWALGNLIAWGWRVGIFEQHPVSGDILLDADYSMWVTGPDITYPATWANMPRQNLWETRRHFGFSDNQRFFTMPIMVRVNRRLQDHECLAIYTEGESTSVNTRHQYWLRTLVSTR